MNDLYLCDENQHFSETCELVWVLNSESSYKTLKSYYSKMKCVKCKCLTAIQTEIPDTSQTINLKRARNRPFSGCRSGLSCANFHLRQFAHTAMTGCNFPPWPGGSTVHAGHESRTQSRQEWSSHICYVWRGQTSPHPGSSPCRQGRYQRWRCHNRASPSARRLEATLG